MATIKSIEEKAKAYDERLAKARKEYSMHEANNAIGITEALERVFPELKESEDERIRKALIKLVKKAGEGYENVIDGVSIENAISWLEKQGEQKEVAPKFRVGDTIRNIKYPSQVYKINKIERWCYISGETEHTSIRILITDQDKWELVEQKPAWSEEDEKKLHSVFKMINESGYTKSIRDDYKDWIVGFKDRIQPKQEWNNVSVPPKFPCDILFKYPNGNKFIFRYLENGRSNDADTPIFSSLVRGEWIYLNDVYPQTTWKPSDEQINALNYVVNLMASSERSTENDLYYNILKSLRQQLKKLKE